MRSFVNEGGHLSREGVICQGRPFVQKRDHSPFVNGRRPFFEGGRGPFVEGGGHSWKGEAVRHLSRPFVVRGGRSPFVEGGRGPVHRKGRPFAHSSFVEGAVRQGKSFIICRGREGDDRRGRRMFAICRGREGRGRRLSMRGGRGEATFNFDVVGALGLGCITHSFDALAHKTEALRMMVHLKAP